MHDPAHLVRREESAAHPAKTALGEFENFLRVPSCRSWSQGCHVHDPAHLVRREESAAHPAKTALGEFENFPSCTFVPFVVTGLPYA